MSHQYQMAKLDPSYGNYGYQQNMNMSTPTTDSLNGPVEQRSCTDLFCCILFLISCCAFFGLAGYCFYIGSPSKVLGLYSYDGQLCYNNATSPLAYMPNLLNTSDPNMISVACVSSCPVENATVPDCSGWSTYCTATPPTAKYSTVPVGSFFCAPDPTLVNNATQISASDIAQSMTDTQSAYLVLIGAVVAAFILGIIYFVFLRCCAGVVIWLSIFTFVLAMIAIGVYMFLYTQGIEIVKSPFDLSSANVQSMQIASYVLWSVSLIAIILTIVLYKTIKLAIAVIKCTAIYIAETCHIIFFPPLMAIVLMLVIAAYLTGLLFAYTTSDITLTTGVPFAVISPNVMQIVFMAVVAFTGLWMVLYFNGVTSFVLSSSATIWYFSNSSTGETPHRPLTTSMARLTRYHQGTVAFGSLVLALFFMIRLLSAFFKASPDKVSENRCFNCCIKCLTCFGSIFNLYLFDLCRCMRFLTKGAWVQCALKGTNYCTSSQDAFHLIASNPIRMTLSAGLSSIVTLLGKLSITFIVLIAAYYVMSSLTYFQVLVKNPVIPSVICGLIAFAVSNLYMAVYGTSCNAIIQCFIMDELDAKNRGLRARYCPGPLREIIDDNTYN